MSKTLISVIIPVFNVEKYLARCLDTVITQTYTNLQIILVDDGSKDSSGNICEKYAWQDNRIMVLHRENRGPGGARNAGLDVATGEYVVFIDGDDYITNDYIEYLYKLLEENRADMSMCSLKKIYNEKEELDECKEKVEIMSSEEAICNLLCQRKVHPAVHCKLYKKEIFSKIRFPEELYYEDLAIIYRIFDVCEKIVIGTKQKYYYFQHRESIMNQSFNEKKMYRIQAANDLKDFVDKQYPTLREEACVRCLIAGIQVFREIPKEKGYQQYIDDAWEQIVKYRRNAIFCRKTKLSTRLMALSTYFGKSVLGVLGLVYTKLLTRTACN